MDQSSETAAGHEGAGRVEHRSEIEVRVRRAPRYGTFMAIGAVLGAVVMWIIGTLMPPGVNVNGDPVDTTPVIGLAIVAGFVVGAGLGGLVAVIIDRVLAKRGATLRAEQRDFEAVERPVEAQIVDEDAGSVDAAVEPIERERDDPREV